MAVHDITQDYSDQIIAQALYRRENWRRFLLTLRIYVGIGAVVLVTGTIALGVKANLPLIHTGVPWFLAIVAGGSMIVLSTATILVFKAGRSRSLERTENDLVEPFLRLWQEFEIDAKETLDLAAGHDEAVSIQDVFKQLVALKILDGEDLDSIKWLLAVRNELVHQSEEVSGLAYAIALLRGISRKLSYSAPSGEAG